MPTKPNRAGQQQNYVPQGNGDASGEYADHATGSNIHFTNFKKPDEEKSFTDFKKQEVEEVKQPEQKPEENKYLGGSKAKSNFYVAMLTSGISNSKNKVENEEEFIAKLKDVIANANEDSINVLQYAFDNYPVAFTENRFKSNSSYFCPGSREIYIDKNGFDRGFEEQGAPLFHELGHYLNDVFKIREDEKWYRVSHILTDSFSLFEDKKAVSETLQEELKEFTANKNPAKIRKDKYKYANNILKQYGFTAEEYEKNIDKGLYLVNNDPEWLSIKSRIQNDFNNNRFKDVDEANETLRRELAIWKKTGSYRELFDSIDRQRPYYVKASNEWFKKTGMQAVSDVWSSKTEHGFGLGHNRKYYSKDKYSSIDPKTKLADELFANFYAAYSTNDKASLETTQKYFPRTYDKMLKLVDYIKNKRTKNEEMKAAIEKFQRGETIWVEKN